jgi:hypothetical protein
VFGNSTTSYEDVEHLQQQLHSKEVEVLVLEQELKQLTEQLQQQTQHAQDSAAAAAAFRWVLD